MTAHNRAAVAVVGAGYTGRALVAELVADGVPVLAITRRGVWGLKGEQQLGESAPVGVELVAHDLLHDAPQALREQLERFEVRALVACHSRAYSRQGARELYVGGAQALLEAVEGLGLERFVYTSSTAALPELSGWVDETCEAWPDSERGRVHRQAEAIYAEGCEAMATPWCILRLAGLYGPGRELRSIYGRPSRRSHSDPVENWLRATNLVHRDDAVAALRAALALPSDRSLLVHVCDDDHRSRAQMVVELGLADATQPLPAEVSSQLDVVRGKRVANDLMKSQLGVKLRHPTHQIG